MKEKVKTELFVERVCQTAKEMGVENYIAYASDGDLYTLASIVTEFDIVVALMEMADSDDPSYRKAILAAASLIEAAQAKEADDED